MQRTLIVLVETTHPGNVGAAARAMKTMGLNRLALVNPRCSINAEAFARASGAADVLELAMMLETQALDLYSRMAQKSAVESTRELFLRLADEEKIHLGFQ